MMTKMRSAWLGACFIALTVASCGFPRLSELADAGGGDDAMAPPFGRELLAGDIGGPGNVDGTGAAAHFNGPSSVAVDSAGNVYVADETNCTIRKVTAGGVVTTLAGTAGMAGSVDGTGVAARFNYPRGVAVDSAGNAYVADNGNSTIRKVTAGGVVTTLAGTAGRFGSVDGTGAAARFYDPTSVALDSAGNIYVADYDNHTIRKVTAGGVVTTMAGSAGAAGSADGTGAAARFNNPGGVAVDGAGNVYVADYGNATIRKITPSGDTTTVAGMAGVAGIVLGAAPRFALPAFLAISGDSLVISDANAILLLRHVVE
jgi:sugar lactone lactonase YvrE